MSVAGLVKWAVAGLIEGVVVGLVKWAVAGLIEGAVAGLGR